MAVCFAVMLVVWLFRRAFHGIVASSDVVFFSSLGVLAAGLVILALAFIDTKRRAQKGYDLPWWRLIAGAIIDLGVPFTLLSILHFHSPRGAYAALSAPALLIVPIVIMLSVLRLRPLYSLLLGLSAAIAHAALCAHTFSSGAIESNTLPVVFSYGVLLALTGAAAYVLAAFVRTYIQEAVAEAEAAERSSRELAAVSRELDIARDIQRGLMPSEPPGMEGFDIAGMARPATQAGGDYYDWQPLPDGRLIVAIADVSGHGVGPALVMAVCRAYARATVPTSRSAADFLETLNRLIINDLTSGRFITMAVALISPDGNVELLSAGHGPTFLFCAASRQVRDFGGDGLPLGLSAGERYDPTLHLRLDAGDALVLLTDGFAERLGPGGAMFGMDRLSRVIADNGKDSAARLIASIDHAATEFAGDTAQNDDMTAVVIRRVDVANTEASKVLQLAGA